MKLLPLPRRVRMRLYKSEDLGVELVCGWRQAQGPSSSPFWCNLGLSPPGEVVILNVDVMLSAGWNLQGEMYKALLWGAMNSKVKAVIASPPTRGFEPPSEFISPASYEARFEKDQEMLAKTFFLYLVAYTAMKGMEPRNCGGSSYVVQGVLEARYGCQISRGSSRSWCGLQ